MRGIILSLKVYLNKLSMLVTDDAIEDAFSIVLEA